MILLYKRNDNKPHTLNYSKNQHIGPTILLSEYTQTNYISISQKQNCVYRIINILSYHNVCIPEVVFLPF